MQGRAAAGGWKQGWSERPPTLGTAPGPWGTDRWQRMESLWVDVVRCLPWWMGVWNEVHIVRDIWARTRMVNRFLPAFVAEGGGTVST